MNKSELPPYDAFFSKFRNMNPLVKDFSDYQELLSLGLKTEETLSKLKLSKPAPSGEKNYKILTDLWEYVHVWRLSTLVQQWRRCPNTQSNAKMLAFYHKKGADMLKLGCTIPKLAQICHHKSTSAKFYPLTETDRNLVQKIREETVGGSSIVFTRKAVVNETFFPNSGKIWKSFVGIDANQLYRFSMCQPVPAGLYTWWEYDTKSKRFKPQQNKSRNFENMVMSCFQRQKPDCKIESFYTTENTKKIDWSKADGFCPQYNTVFEAKGCFYHYHTCQEGRRSLTKESIKRGYKKWKMDQMRKQ